MTRFRMLARPSRMRKALPFFLCLSIIGAISGCVSLETPAQLTERAEEKAARAGFHLRLVDAPPFRITSWEHVLAPEDPNVSVYIEGDGKAWLSRYELAMNPTPRNPLALALAMEDPAPNILYIARPCQFTPPAEDPHCQDRYWSSARFAPEVIASLQQVIDQYVEKTHAKRVHLVGFSGGGGVAALLAAGRKDVVSLTTVAGNLDIALHAELHHITALTQSLNPADKASATRHIPQTHFVGAEDDNVPIAIAESYRRHAGEPSTIRIIEVPGASHAKGWEERWRALLRK